MASQTASRPSLTSGAPAQTVSNPQAVPNSEDDTSKPKPCCVCKEEKAKRDDCMLFSDAADPMKDCQSTIDRYKTCMAGFGFKI